MTWQPIDFQSIVSFDKALSEQLQHYLEDKQTYYSQLIASSIPTELGASIPLLAPSHVQKTLSEGVDIFTRKVNQSLQSRSTDKIRWENLANTLNAYMWEYTELLQGIAVELFQQLEQVGIEQWRAELLNVVKSIKEILLHRMDDLKWALKRLESSLVEYRQNQTPQSKTWLSQFFPPWKTIIDHNINKNLEKSQKFLNFRYQNFQHRYEQYIDLDSQIEKRMSKFLSYHILGTLDTNDQDNFKRLYRMLKLWKLNQQAKAIPERELIRVLRYSINPDKASNLFKSYFKALQNKLFSQSRRLKEPLDKLHDEITSANEAIRQLEFQSSLSGQRFELHTLGATISAYRTFLLESDPNPYVRTRGGFSEWIVGQEPSQTKLLTEQEFDIEKLDAQYKLLSDSFRNNYEISKANQEHICRQIQAILHDMGQPLASQAMMTRLANEFVHKLSDINELGSHSSDSVERITTLLSRALRADWKYTSLYDIPLFHDLYAIHMHILPPITDRNHINRLRQFKLLIDKLRHWVHEKNVQTHLNEIELTINDMKGYLQDFLAQIQRISRDESFTKAHGPGIISIIYQQLLEYRYLFGHFFHQLRQTEMEEKLLRNRFLFVDQYFETIENKLIEMREEIDRMQDT
ncbi:MAG: hypothetical protein H0T62_04040 [Parachlamydiaceae bacterium]|nr:hypothetical protein [Parachlamydiaceae bacterium]